MQEHQLFNPEGPALSVPAATSFTVAKNFMAWIPAHPEWDGLRVRGGKSIDEERFFDEVAAALQFPCYFGENWDALWDCITDLNWSKGSSFLAVFDSADQLLSHSDRGFKVLLEELADAHTLWRRETADFGIQGRQPVAFQSVLPSEPESVDALTRRTDTAGSTFTLL